MVAGHPFLEGLSEAHLRSLAPLATDRIFATGDFLCRKGEPATAFYLVREGKVALEVHVVRRPGLRIETVHAGALLGWSWMMPPYRWRLDARALEPVRATAVDAAKLRRLCETDHELGHRIAARMTQVIAHRLQRTRARLLRLYGSRRREGPREPAT